MLMLKIIVVFIVISVSVIDSMNSGCLVMMWRFSIMLIVRKNRFSRIEWNGLILVFSLW